MTSAAGRGVWVALATLGLLCAVAPRDAGDGMPGVLFAGAEALVARGSLDVQHQAPRLCDGFPDVKRQSCVRATQAQLSVIAEGHEHLRLPLGPQLLLTPAALLERLAPGSGAWAGWALGVLAAVALALVCLRFYTAEWGSARAAAALTLALFASTTLLAASRRFDGGVVAALLLTLAVAAVRARARDGVAAPWRTGAALGALVVVDPALTGAALVVAVAATRARPADISIAVVWAWLVAGIGVAAAHAVSVGAPWSVDGWADGLYGLVLSTGKGVVWFSPLVLVGLLGLLRPRRADAWLWLTLAAGWLGLGLDARWHGDPAFGPVRLAPLLPLLLFPVGAWLTQRRGRLVCVALVSVGLALQLLGAVVRPESYVGLVKRLRHDTGAPTWFVQPPADVHFIPQFSPLSGHLFVVRAWLRPAPPPHPAPWHFLLPSAPPLDAEARALPVDLAAARSSAAAALAGAALLLALGAATLALRRRPKTL